MTSTRQAASTAEPSIPALNGAAPSLQPLTASGSRVIRNSGFALLGPAVPFGLAVLAMPVLTRALGAPRFGILGLGWALLEYLSLFDIGLGRATTRFVAERVAQRDRGLASIVIASASLQTLFGAVAGVALALLSPLLAHRVFAIPAELRHETQVAFLILASTMPMVLLSLALRGVLEAAGRFDLSAAVRIPSGTATFLLPALGASLGLKLPGIFFLLLLSRIVTCGVLILAVRRALPGVTWNLRTQWQLPKGMLAFGGWIAVSNFASPILVYLDRFMLGAIAGVTVVGLYTPAYEAATRLLILPGSLLNAAFPIVSAASADDRDRLARLFLSLVRHLLVLLAPIVLLLAVFAPEVLHVWLGPQYASNSASALRILAIGVVINGLGHVPCGYLQARGRPDLPARFHLVELALHVPLTWVLVHRLGITGAALAWTIRVTADAVMLFVAAHRVLHLSLPRALGGRGARAIVALVGFASLTTVATIFRSHPHALVVTLAAIIVCFVVGVWRGVFDDAEREAALHALALGRFSPRLRRTEPSPFTDPVAGSASARELPLRDVEPA